MEQSTEPSCNDRLSMLLNSFNDLSQSSLTVQLQSPSGAFLGKLSQRESPERGYA